MKRFKVFIACIVLLVSCFDGFTVLGENRTDRILKLMNENPVEERRGGGSAAATGKDEGSMNVVNTNLNANEINALNEIKRVSSLYSVSTEIVSLSSDMDIEEYYEIEDSVNNYISSVADAEKQIDVSGLTKTDEYKELVSNRTILNETIDMQPPGLVRVDSIYPGECFRVRVHTMYKSDSSRDFSLQFKNISSGNTVETKKGVIKAGEYNCDLTLTASGCGAGDEVSIIVIYNGVLCSQYSGCSFKGKVLSRESDIEIETAADINSFADIDVKHGRDEDTASEWSDWEVKDAVELGIVPDEMVGGYKLNITREGFCRLAARAIECRSGMGIEDYAAAYADKEAVFCDTANFVIMACAELGIVNGFEDGSFRPDASITREQAAAMLARCARKLGLSDKAGIFIFNDNDSISGWARGHVRYVRANEIMNGDENNNFCPADNYTTEQAIVTFYRMYTKL